MNQSRSVLIRLFSCLNNLPGSTFPSSLSYDFINRIHIKKSAIKHAKEYRKYIKNLAPSTRTQNDPVNKKIRA